jgi:hypothetical protein
MSNLKGMIKERRLRKKMAAKENCLRKTNIKLALRLKVHQPVILRKKLNRKGGGDLEVHQLELEDHPVDLLLGGYPVDLLLGGRLRQQEDSPEHLQQLLEVVMLQDLLLAAASLKPQDQYLYLYSQKYPWRPLKL